VALSPSLDLRRLICLAVVFLLGPFGLALIREQGGCSDCTELWGRWWEPGLLLYWLTLLLAAWIAGVLIGRALRR
jgi:hypothetical protein